LATTAVLVEMCGKYAGRPGEAGVVLPLSLLVSREDRRMALSVGARLTLHDVLEGLGARRLDGVLLASGEALQ
jgi:hypothetical protein